MTDYRGQYLDKRLEQRILTSPLSLVVHFPPPRQVATGTSPGTAPVSPLTRPGPTPAVFPITAAPSRDPVTLKCLWYSAYEGAVGSARRNSWDRLSATWVAEADSLARVLCSDAEVTSGMSFGDSIFTTCSHVEFQGKQYKVVGVHPVTSGWKEAKTLHVWLKGDVS